MKKNIVLILMLCCGKFVLAQDTAGVRQAVSDYVEAFYYGDTNKIHRSISPDAYKYGYSRRKDSTNYLGMQMTFRQMIEYATGVLKRGVSPNVEKFPRKIDLLDVLDVTASAKLTAWWGTDYILLAKPKGKWIITHVLWQSPPPPPK